MPGPLRCTIRDVEIETPYWTYCANHQHHNPARIELPIGPIYAYAGDGWPYRRKIIVESPDTPGIRFELLSLLCDIEETPQPEYPTPTKLDETVIRQLGMFREPRAAGELRRIIAFDPFAQPENDPFRRDRIATIAAAIEALVMIEGDGALPELERCLSIGLDTAQKLDPYTFESDALASIRYQAVESLPGISRDVRRDLLDRAIHDPNPDVAELARKLAAK